MIIADTSGLLALFNRAERRHEAAVEAVRAQREPLDVSPFVVAELGFLVATRIDPAAAVTVLRELAGGAYVLPALDDADLKVAADLMERYLDQAIGVADASLVVLADRYATRRILTLDRRHVGAIRALDGAPLALLP